MYDRFVICDPEELFREGELPTERLPRLGRANPRGASQRSPKRSWRLPVWTVPLGLCAGFVLANALQGHLRSAERAQRAWTGASAHPTFSDTAPAASRANGRPSPSDRFLAVHPPTAPGPQPRPAPSAPAQSAVGARRNAAATTDTVRAALAPAPPALRPAPTVTNPGPSANKPPRGQLFARLRPTPPRPVEFGFERAER